MKRMDGFYFVIDSRGRHYLYNGEKEAKRCLEFFEEEAKKGHLPFLDFPEVREAMIDCNGRVLPSGLKYYFD